MAAAPRTVRPRAEDDLIYLSVGSIVPVEEFAEGQEDHEWNVEDEFVLGVDEAAELLNTLPTAIAAALSFIANRAQAETAAAEAAAMETPEPQTAPDEDEDDEDEDDEPKAKTRGRAKAKS